MKRNLLETFKPEFESKAGLTPTFLVSQVVVRRPPDVDVTWAKGRNHCASSSFRNLKNSMIFIFYDVYILFTAFKSSISTSPYWPFFDSDGFHGTHSTLMHYAHSHLEPKHRCAQNG